ncbi:YegP family protein [Nonomuraea sp. NPDC049684]|uniref:YegP family protein n=1 Tax=unclassified Nonomuraea TaxID=2593643 RepID=UPI0037918E8C
MAGHYLLKKTPSGYRFNLVAGNGEIIATSESYTTKASALNGIDAVRRNADSRIDDQTGEQQQAGGASQR